MDILRTFLKNILQILRGQISSAILIAFLFMFLYLYARQYGWKLTIKTWWLRFREEERFRKIFFLVLYISMLVSCTLLKRTVWMTPLENVFGGWGFYTQTGELTTSCIENVLLFIPLTSLLFWNFHKKIFTNKFTFLTVLLKSILFSFMCSLTIEVSQLIFFLGTFQLSDLCYNTFGGTIGGMLYWCWSRIAQVFQKEDFNEDESK